MTPQEANELMIQLNHAREEFANKEILATAISHQKLTILDKLELQKNVTKALTADVAARQQAFQNKYVEFLDLKKELRWEAGENLRRLIHVKELQKNYAQLRALVDERLTFEATDKALLKARDARKILAD